MKYDGCISKVYLFSHLLLHHYSYNTILLFLKNKYYKNSLVLELVTTEPPN